MVPFGTIVGAIVRTGVSCGAGLGSLVVERTSGAFVGRAKTALTITITTAIPITKIFI